MKYDLSICIPGIRTQNWREIYDSVCASVGDKTFEILFGSPYDLPDNMQGLPNVKLFKDWGSPTRCLQIISEHCEGELITNTADDGVAVADGINKAIDLYRSVCGRQDGIIMKYTEGKGRPTHTDTHASAEYWTPAFHDSLKKLGGFNQQFKWGLWMMDLSYFREVGGLDCKYEPMNFSCHDLLYRIQNNGGQMHLSSTFVYNFDWDPWAKSYQVVQKASNKDYAVFVADYTSPTDRYKIPFDNWKDAPEKWARFQ